MMTISHGVRGLAAGGSAGFEGLVQRLIEELTGYPLYLSRAGDQRGRDMRSAAPNGA
jgi:hypothetical protein